MSRLWRVAAREYLENVKTKTFLIAVGLTPVMMALSLLVPVLLEGQKPKPRTIAVADVTGRLAPGFADALLRPEGQPERTQYTLETVDLGAGDDAAREARANGAKKDLDARVKRGDLFAWVRIRPSAITRQGPPSEYRTGTLVDAAVMQDVRAAIRRAADARIGEDRRIPEEAVAVLAKGVPYEAGSVLSETSGGSVAAAITPFAFAFLLFLTIVTVSQALITSTIEEKGNRVIEVLLSSLSAVELMGGKILGNCLVGLTLMTIWSIGGLVALASNGLLSLVEPSQLLLCLVYYLLGFGLIASLMVAAGSACNTLKEAQNLLSPLMFLLAMPMLFWLAVAKDPHGTLAVVLSFVPLFTPFLMMMRIGGTTPPPPLEIGASIVVLALSTWLAVRLAARVFRVGVLLYGKPPSLREIVRWMRVKT